MKIGVHVVNARPWATAESIVSLGTRAEELGFDSLWVSDQVVIPSELRSSFSYGATGQYDIEANQNFLRGPKRSHLPRRAHQSSASRDERARVAVSPTTGIGQTMGNSLRTFWWPD